MTITIVNHAQEVSTLSSYWGKEDPKKPTLSPSFRLYEKEFTTSKLGKKFLKYANLAIEKNYVAYTSLPELVLALNTECQKGYCRGHAYERLIRHNSLCVFSKNSQDVQQTRILFFQAIPALAIKIVEKAEKDLGPIEEELERKTTDASSSEQEQLATQEEAFTDEIERRSLFIDKLFQLELTIVNKLSDLAYHGEEEVQYDERACQSVAKIISNKSLTSFVLGFHFKKDGHAIHIQSNPSYRIFDANAGVMEHSSLTSLLSSLSSHIQKLQEDADNPLENITIQKFSSPILLQEIDIVN